MPMRQFERRTEFTPLDRRGAEHRQSTLAPRLTQPLKPPCPSNSTVLALAFCDRSLAGRRVSSSARVPGSLHRYARPASVPKTPPNTAFLPFYCQTTFFWKIVNVTIGQGHPIKFGAHNRPLKLPNPNKWRILHIRDQARIALLRLARTHHDPSCLSPFRARSGRAGQPGPRAENRAWGQ
jgi:hypothetical protein